MLLATDLDGTFLAGDTAARTQLYQLITTNPDIQLVFVTGRGLENVLPLLADPTIPQPHYIICDVGGTVVDGESQQAVQPIQGEIDGRWPGEVAIEEIMAQFPGLVRQDVPQERRCSYFCPPNVVTQDIRAAVEGFGCDLLYSAGRYLDVLPKNVNKGATLTKLVEFLGVDPEEVLVAGDTLNDLSMYHQQFKGVCVGESESGLLEATKALPYSYHAEAPGCGGILEAIQYFNFLGKNSIEQCAGAELQFGDSELVIVYHRLPFEEKMENGKKIRQRPKSPNGIIPTLLSFFADGKSGSWVAWTIDESDLKNTVTERVKVDTENYPNLTAAVVPLPKNDVDIFYKKFSKEAFWPTLHTFWERASFNQDHWEVFLQVNKRFAEATAAEAAEGAVAWIHDYNLWMVPAFLREMRPDLTIAFFHHTYFPSADVFNVLPWRRDIVGSLLQCDFIGFHIPRQSENFVDVARGVMPVKTTEKTNCAPRFLTYGCAVGLETMTSEISIHDRKVRLGAHPVGLDLERINRSLTLDSVQTRMAELREHFKGTRLLLSVERLDYTKGTLEKLEAFERLLDTHPELVGKITLLTICVPAAREMTIYQTLQSQIEQAVGRINGRFGKPGWTPLEFYFRSFPFEELVAFYAVADLMWITPLRDGLNLVAKEYIATQGLTQGSGVLVLSEFTGAAAELRGAILTNPHDPVEMVEACYWGLNMTQDEARDRLTEAFDVVKHYDIDYWGREFLAAVNATEVNE